MFDTLEYTLLFILIIECVSYFKRKHALNELTKSISKLTIKTQQESDFVSFLANYSINPRQQFIFMIFLPYFVYKLWYQSPSDKVHFDLEKDTYFADFKQALRFNIICTSPTIFLLTTIIFTVMQILLSVVPKKSQCASDSMVDIIERYAH